MHRTTTAATCSQHSLLIAILATLVFVVPAAAGDSLESKVRKHQAEVRRKIDKARREMKLSPQRSNASPVHSQRHGKSSRVPQIQGNPMFPGNQRTGGDDSHSRSTRVKSGASYAKKHVDAKTEYGFDKGNHLIYRVEIHLDSESTKKRWQGSLTLDTTHPTPQRSDGSYYDSGRVKTSGYLTAHEKGIDGDWWRQSGEDINFTGTATFRPMEVSAFRPAEPIENTLTKAIKRKYSLLSLLFPNVPMWEGTSEGDLSPGYFYMSKGYSGFGAGNARGKGHRSSTAKGYVASSKQDMVVATPDGKPLFSYQTQQKSSFLPRRSTMNRSGTVFTIQEGTTQRIWVDVKRVDSVAELFD